MDNKNNLKNHPSFLKNRDINESLQQYELKGNTIENTILSFRESRKYGFQVAFMQRSQKEDQLDACYMILLFLGLCPIRDKTTDSIMENAIESGHKIGSDAIELLSFTYRHETFK
jgi:hypothetical protein